MLTARESSLSRFIASYAMALILTAVACAGIWLTWYLGVDVMTFSANRGFLLPSPNLWIFGRPDVSLALNVGLLLLSAAVMLWANARYSITRNFSPFFVGLFLMATAATPAVATRFSGGTLLALAIIVALMLMYSGYNAVRRSARAVFLAFLIITAGAMTQYGFLVYTGVFFMGIGQMRVFRLRTVAAAMLGVITPVWLLYAFLPGDFPQLHTPELNNPFSTLGLADRIRFFATLGITMFAGLILGALNMMKIYSYNAKARSINGLLTVTGVITALAALVDWTNVAFYVPLLNAFVAFQVSHFMHIHAGKRYCYIALLTLVVVYLGMLVWSIF